MAILVTGGTGYIGSHTSIELLKRGEQIVVLDNLSNSKIEMCDSIKKLSGKDFKFYQVDLLDKPEVERVFKENKIDEVIHFAGLKAVGESCEKPIEYYHNNITGTLNLVDVMRKNGCKKIVFSSSATVYGDPKTVPIKEDFPLSTTNPYGSTKLMIERILTDVYKSDNKWSVILLRYFNPIGAHPSGLIGENPNGIPNNLMPYIQQVAVGILPMLKVYGNDYDTVDGTGMRDYIHVVDLAKAHLSAISYLLENDIKGCDDINIGTGKSTSVLQLVNAFQKVNNITIPYVIVERREGDIANIYADTTKAKQILNWQSKYSIEDMCKDAYHWQLNLQKKRKLL